MIGYVLHPQAYADMVDIWEYVATDNLDAADRVREEIHEAITGLTTFPHQGHRRPI
jgi:plasmid stabilization system protein ParE